MRLVYFLYFTLQNSRAPCVFKCTVNVGEVIDPFPMSAGISLDLSWWTGWFLLVTAVYAEQLLADCALRHTINDSAPSRHCCKMTSGIRHHSNHSNGLFTPYCFTTFSFVTLRHTARKEGALGLPAESWIQLQGALRDGSCLYATSGAFLFSCER